MTTAAATSAQISTPPRSWIELDEQALLHNARWAAERVAPARLLPVVKANAYHHGALRVARLLEPFAGAFAVANLREALELRRGGIAKDLLLLGPCLPEERAAVIAHDFLPTVSSLEEALAYGELAEEGRRVRLHFKIDTGMGRIGAWKEEGIAALSALSKDSAIQIEMISTHLSAADEDRAFTLEQLNWFRSQEPKLRAWFPRVRMHALNSAGIIRHPEFSFDLVRPGLMIYGLSPVPEASELLRPVIQWKTRIILLRKVGEGRRVSYGGEFVTPRPSVLAVLAVGYADGYFRQIRSGTADVLVRGVRCPVVGRITMDQIIADVTSHPAVRELEVGEQVTLLGHEGGEEITATEMARWAGTIPWHVLTAIGNRVDGL